MTAAALIGCNPPPPDEGGYAQRVADSRAAKDAEFQRTNDPVPDNRKSVVLPLSYYPSTRHSRCRLYSSPIHDARREDDHVDGNAGRSRVLGTLAFTVKGQTLTLTAFASPDNRVFVPFQDADKR